MNKLVILIFLVFSSQFADAQQLETYVFARTSQIVNFRLSQPDANYTQGLSMGVGLTHSAHILELGTFIFDGNSYGYYSFFGSTLKAAALADILNLNTNWFGEVTHLPEQGEGKDVTWIYTGGICLFPNVQLNRLNIGITLCMGLGYQEKELYLNSRFILNLAYLLSKWD